MSGTEIALVSIIGVLLLFLGVAVASVVYTANGAIDAFNERADRDSVRLDILVNQAMAISEANLEAFRIQHQSPALAAPRPEPRRVPSMEEIFSTENPPGGVGDVPA